MDALLERYMYPIDLSSVHYDDLRDMLGFYTNEAGRADLQVGAYEAHLNDLQNKRDELGKNLMRHMPINMAKWRAQVELEGNKKLKKLDKEIRLVEQILKILKPLARDNDRKAKALSREMSTRQRDQENISRSRST